MNQQHAYTFVQFSDIAINWHFCIRIIVNIYVAPLLDPKTFDKRRFIFSNKNWLGGWGVWEIFRKQHVNFANFKQKSYFCDNDAIFDVAMQNRLENDVITPNINSAGIHLLYYHSIIFIFRQIDKDNFAVRGPSSWYFIQFWY